MTTTHTTTTTQTTNDHEPKGYCPFCSVSGWEICDHFKGYLRHEGVFCELPSKTGRICKTTRPRKLNEVTVPTGVSIRVYARGK